MKDGDEIKLSLNSLDSLIAPVEILVNGEVVPECIAVFNRWFDIYSSDNKMHREHAARFLRDVTGSREMPSVDDPRLGTLFSVYDRTNQGFLERENFVKFYIESTKDRKKTVWENMKSMGIRNDLKLV